jgi:cellulose synthase operon protein C
MSEHCCNTPLSTQRVTPRPMAQTRRGALPPRTVRATLAGMALVAAVCTLAACSRDDPLAKGRQLLEDGKPAAAVLVLKGAVDARPRDVAARLALAEALQRRSDLAGALQQLQQAMAFGGPANELAPRIAHLQLDRSDYEALIREFSDTRLTDALAQADLRAALAMAHLGMKRPAQAHALLIGVADTPGTTIARAQLLLGAGKLREAVALVSPIAADGSAPWWALRAASRVAKAAGQDAQALHTLQLAQQAAPWHRGLTGEYAEALISAGQADAARAVRNRLAQAASNDYWVVYLDALLFAQAGRVEDSHAAALRILAKMPEHVAATLLVAQAELLRGDALMAEKRLLALDNRQPNHLPVMRLLAQAQLRSARADVAAATVQRALAQSPQDPTMLDLRAQIESSRGQHREAAGTLTQLLTARPGDTDLMLRLAGERAVLGQGPASTRLLTEAAERSLKDPAILGRAIALALRLRETALAQRLADQGLAATPEHPQARLNLAAVQSALGRNDDAWATTLAALDRQPAAPLALSALSAMARTEPQRTELLKRHAKAVESGDVGASAFLDYARLLRQTPGAKPSPRSVLEKGVKRLPTAVPLRQALVDDLMRAGDAQAALALAQTGAAMGNATAAAQWLLADTYARLGRDAQATEAYRKLVAHYPHRPDWRLKLAQLEADAGRRAEAIALLRGLVNERPFDLTPQVTLARLLQSERPAEALVVARQMGQQPGLAGAALLLEGDLLAGAGQIDKAAVAYQGAARAGMDPQAGLRRVGLFDGAGRRPQADEALGQLMKQHADNPAVLAKAAERRLGSGDAVGAVALLEPLVARDPRNALLRNDLAWAQLQAGQPQAVDNARLAAAALPNHPEILDTMAQAQLRFGRREDAIATWRTASQVAPGAALPRIKLSEQLLAAGQKSDAAKTVKGLSGKGLGQADQARLDKLKSALGVS